MLMTCLLSLRPPMVPLNKTIISDFTDDNEPFLNQTKTEVVRFSINSDTHNEHIQIVDSAVPVLSQAKCLGYHWSKTPVEENIKKAMKRFCFFFFALGASGCYLGTASPLSTKSMFEKCVLPTLYCMVPRTGSSVIEPLISLRPSKLKLILIEGSF